MKLSIVSLGAIVAALAVIVTAQLVKADGPGAPRIEPVVTPPAQTWAGPYVGLAYGRVSSKTETIECFKLGVSKACDDPIFGYYPEYKVEVRTETKTSDDRAGLLLGYRWDTGVLVPGVELALYDGKVLPGAQLGLDLNRVLPYAHYDRDGAAFGVEAKLTTHLSAGVRAGSDATSFTLSWGF